MVTYNTILSDQFYIHTSKKIAEYFSELAIMAAVPVIDKSAETPDALYYRHTNLLETKASRGIADKWSPQGPVADTQHGYTDFKCMGKEMHLAIPKNGINLHNQQFLFDAKQRQAMMQMALDVDDCNIFGNYEDPADDRTKLLDDGGLITQATTVEDLNGTDSNLSTKGDIIKGVNKMIDAIPLRIRQNAPPMKMLVSENLVANGNDGDHIYIEKTEIDLLREKFVTNPIKNRAISEIIITDKILVTGTDTKGTNDRIVIFVPDERICARIVTRGFSLLGEESRALDIHQVWGWRGCFAVFDANGVQMSEQIVWA